jgi:hypothetical protein
MVNLLPAIEFVHWFMIKNLQLKYCIEIVIWFLGTWLLLFWMFPGMEYPTIKWLLYGCEKRVNGEMIYLRELCTNNKKTVFAWSNENVLTLPHTIGCKKNFIEKKIVHFLKWFCLQQCLCTGCKVYFKFLYVWTFGAWCNNLTIKVATH